MHTGLGDFRNPNHPNPTLDKLAARKLELSVKEAEKK